jgi:hypothetical protein
MNIKYRSGYAEGGFLDDGAEVDPISGNEVPVGSLAEEVRDDVPAQLSEGEFVVPADVVRFIGLEKLMQMRDQAKSGLAQMESDGQMGGSPAPMQSEMDDAMEMDALIDGMDSEDFDGAVQAFAEGGSVLPSYAQYTGREFGEAGNVEYVKYTNDAGDIIDVATVQGNPVNAVPNGYYPVGSKSEEEEVATGAATVQSSSGGDGKKDNLRDPSNPWQNIVSDTDSDAIKRHHQLKSDKVTRNRYTALKDVALQMEGETSSTMVNKTMQNYMTPEALTVRERWLNNPNFVDKLFLKNMTPTEINLAAQRQVNNARTAAGKPDPYYDGKPTGETPSFSEVLTGLVSGVITLAESGGIIGLIVKTLAGTDEEKVELQKSLTSQAAEVSVTGVVTPEALATADIVDEVIPTTASYTPYTPADGTEYQPDGSGVAPAIQPTVDPAFKQDMQDVSPPSTPPYEPAAGTEYAPEGSGVAPAVPSIVDSQLKMDIRDVANPVTSTATTTGIPSANIMSGAESDLMKLLDAEDAINTGASLGTTGTAGTTTGVTPITAAMTPEQKKQANVDNITAIAIANGINPQDAIDAWDASGNTGTLEELVVNTATDRDNDRQERQDAKDREVARVAQEEADRTAAATAAQQRILEDQQRRQQAQTDSANAAANKAAADKAAADRAAALESEQRRQQSQTTVNSGGDGRGERQRNAAGGTGGGVRSSSGQSGYQGSSVGEAGRYKGGLIKKMRSDNTTGLASKKKSKEKAKAKKGALAAKRT